ncbi:sugar phosphate isomerase/epimerase family protein [Paenibacillus qinlingensis]|uniref:Sugar phosphate isomerase/epimerase n=1 Tax=Paenibacillus qinlingensis TaxID=1837343 RepID=A0ABU1P5K3_9BACL|nr:sugar phosphate isomerase/epimerase family protein [Paenibacillus qinlingensis]MDR6554849.1 sugar phosphate isomerase/epimerase [Paenibacillus qinlingensis]
MKFAAFSGVLIDYSIQEAMRLTKQLGFDGIEIAAREHHLSPMTSRTQLKELHALSEDLQLAIPVLATYTGRFSSASDQEAAATFDDFRRLLEAAGQLEASMIRVLAGGPNAFLAQDYHYSKAAYWLGCCAEEAKAYNVDVLVELHNETLVETADDALKLSRLVNSERMGFIHDAGNMYIAGTEYGFESVKKLGRHLKHVHIKDERRTSDSSAPGSFTNRTQRGVETFSPCRLGEGEVDHEPLFQALRETGYNNWVTLECHTPESGFERLKHDFDCVMKLANG